MIEGTRYNKNKGYVCQHVVYSVAYTYEQQDVDFDTDLLQNSNELTTKLLAEDRRHAIWETEDSGVERDQRNRDYNVFTTTIRGYNTRLLENTILRKVKSVLGVDSSWEANNLEVVKTYDSVHEGQCPASGGCDETARMCLSDSECQKVEICCQTECEYRCISVTQVSGSTSEPTEMLSSTPGTTPMEGSDTTTDAWYSTSPDPGETEPIGMETEGSETWGTEPWTTAPLTSYDFSTTDPAEEGDSSGSSAGSPREATTDATTTPADRTSTTMTGGTRTERRTTEETGTMTETKPSPEQTTTIPLDTTTILLDETTTILLDETTTILLDETTTIPLDETTTIPLDTTSPVDKTTEFPGESSTMDDKTTVYTTTFVNSLGTETPETFGSSSVVIDPTESATPTVFDGVTVSTPPVGTLTPPPDRTTLGLTETTSEQTSSDVSTSDKITFARTEEEGEDVITGFDESSLSSTLESSWATTVPLTSSNRGATVSASSEPSVSYDNTVPITYITDEITLGTTEAPGSTEPISGNTIEIEILTSLAGTQPTRPLSTEGATTPPATLTSSGSMLSLCEREVYLAGQEGRQGPACLETGDYDPQQCDMARNSPGRGICWCVDDDGLEIKGSMRYGSAGPCENFIAVLTTAPYTTTVPLGDCWKTYQRAVKQQAYDRNVLLPACEANGLYRQNQCHGTYCWCVDQLSGDMVNGTRKPGPIDCDIYLAGVCPEFAREHGSCIDKCDHDAYCYGTTKCCQTQCGRDCVYPQLPEKLKEGLCPTPDSLNSIFERCTVDCSSDDQCAGQTKCCFNGCGYACSEAIYDMNVYCKKVAGLYKGRVVDPRAQYSEGDVLQLQCNHGYQLQGQAEIRCLASGDWEHDLPICKRVSCGMPGSGQFVIVRGNDFWVGGVVTYHCYSGYSLIGASSATCLVSGRWDSQPPTCQRRQCPEQNELRYGRVYGNIRTYGNRVGYRCDYGYTLIGSEQRLCLSDGSWSGTDATCVRGYFSRTRRHKPFLGYDEAAPERRVPADRCQYEAVETIDYNGDCVEDVWTIDCQCGEPNTVEQAVKVVCQRGPYEFIERRVKIGTGCSCCGQSDVLH